MTGRLLLLLLCIRTSYLSKVEPCDLCPPGTYLVESCKDGLPHTTKCGPCPPGTYTEYYNRLDRCLRLSDCIGPNMIITQAGTATRNTVCTCKEGYRMVFEIQFCLRNPSCPPGTGVSKQGNECSRCQRGFYSNEHSFMDACQPWTNCTANGLIVAERGSRLRDVICAPANSTETTRTSTREHSNPTVVTVLRTSNVQDSDGFTVNVFVIALSILTTYSLMLSAYALRCMCRRKDPEMNYDLAMNGRDAEMNYGTATRCEADMHYCTAMTLEQETNYCVPTQDTNDPDEQRRSSCFLEVPLHIDDDDNGRECNTLPLLKTQPKTVPRPPTCISCDPLPNAQITPPVLTSSTRLKSKSSEEYMLEMQTLIAEGYATVLSASAAEHLAAELGPSWRQVARRLGVEQHQIDHIWNENRQNLEKQTFKMLSCWQRDRTGRATISELYGALVACNQDKLCRQLQEMENDLHDAEETKVYCA